MREFYVWPTRKDSIFGHTLSKDDYESAINEDCKEKAFLAREVSPSLDAAYAECEKALEKLSRNFMPMINDPCCERLGGNLGELRVRKLWADEALAALRKARK